MSDQTTFSLNYISDKHPIIISSNLHVYPSNFEILPWSINIYTK